VQPADEDDARHPELGQHRHILVLPDSARGLGAEHGGEALLGERRLQHLGHRREDRVVELGHHQADEAAAAYPQFGRPFVAQDVESGQDLGPGAGADTGPIVQDA